MSMGGHVELLTSGVGSTANISGGIVNDYELSHDSFLNYSGGVIVEGVKFYGRANIYGNDYRLNGAPLQGRFSIGDNTALRELKDNFVLSGILADGTPFAFVNNAFDSDDRDWFDNNHVTVHFTAIPEAHPAEIVVNYLSDLKGIRLGQAIRVESGGEIGPNFSAARGSAVDLAGGHIARNFEAVETQINISSGSVADEFNVFHGSVVNISGGDIGRLFRAYKGSEINISGGTIGKDFRAYPGSEINISGGTVVGTSVAYEGSVVNMSGGSFGPSSRFLNLSKLNLFGKQFVLDGADITSDLTPFVPFTINARDVLLEGVFANGSPFEYYLEDRFERGSTDVIFKGTLTITLVPEPTSFAILVMFGIAFLVPRVRSHSL